jgi:hypothetical protein
MKPSSSGEDSSPSQSASLRRVQSQSNLRQDATESRFPTGPEDVGKWMRRRKSIDTMSRFGVFELDDTSAARPPSEMFAGLDNIAHPARKKSAFRLVV